MNAREYLERQLSLYTPMEVGAAVRLIQRVCGARQDGLLGPQTLARLAEWERAMFTGVVHSWQLVAESRSLLDVRYEFGAEVNTAEARPRAIDCSELIEWAGARLGVTPRIPDGSWLQWQHCIPVPPTIAIRTEGALLFRFKGDPSGRSRPSEAHVSLSLGDSQVIEAAGAHVRQVQTSVEKWTHGGYLPGVVYPLPMGRIMAGS